MRGFPIKVALKLIFAVFRLNYCDGLHISLIIATTQTCCACCRDWRKIDETNDDRNIFVFHFSGRSFLPRYETWGIPETYASKPYFPIKWAMKKQNHVCTLKFGDSQSPSAIIPVWLLGSENPHKEIATTLRKGVCKRESKGK